MVEHRADEIAVGRAETLLSARLFAWHVNASDGSSRLDSGVHTGSLYSSGLLCQ